MQSTIFFAQIYVRKISYLFFFIRNIHHWYNMHIYCSDLIWPVNTEKYISLTPYTVFFKIRKRQLTFSAHTTLYGRIIVRVYSAQRPVVLAPKNLALVHFEASFKRDWDLDLPEKWCQKVHKMKLFWMFTSRFFKIFPQNAKIV